MKLFKNSNNNHLFKSIILLYLIPFLLFYACQPCTCEEDSLDGIKGYKPDDKYFKSALVSLHFIMETSPIDRVDNQFKQLISVHKLPSDASAAKDGVYYGASPYDAFDYRHEVKIEIKDGTIIAVDYNEVHKDGIGKQEDEAYCEEMSITGTTPAIAYPEMEQELLSTQNMMDVDAVSGATYSLYRFRYAVCIALMKAMIEPVASP